MEVMKMTTGPSDHQEQPSYRRKGLRRVPIEKHWDVNLTKCFSGFKASRKTCPILKGFVYGIKSQRVSSSMVNMVPRAKTLRVCCAEDCAGNRI